MQRIRLQGARTHNLAGVSVELSEGELTAVTGVSGSGKSSLAVDTLYAEGQRRFVESFSPYARQFLERLERPPMDSLEPVAAGIAVDRRTGVKSSRSTVATLADLEAYFSALFTREALPVCPEHGEEAVLPRSRVGRGGPARRVSGRDGCPHVPGPRFPDTETFLDVRARLLRDGYRRLLARQRGPPARGAPARGGDGRDGHGRRGGRSPRPRRRRLPPGSPPPSSRPGARARARRTSRSSTASRRRPGFQRRAIRQGLVCPSCARGFEPARPGLFSYQSAVGACPACRGFGRTLGIDWAKVLPDDALQHRGRGAASVERPVERVGARRCSSASPSGSSFPSTSPGASSPRRSARPSSRARAATDGGRYPGAARLVQVDGGPHLQDARARAAQPLPRVRALHRLQRRAAESRRAPLPRRWARPRRLAPAGGGRGRTAAGGARHRVPDRASSRAASCPAASAGWCASGWATSGSIARAARSPAARRSASRSPPRSAPGSPARSSCSTSRRSACTRRISRRSPRR